MIREARLNDYEEIQNICEHDLGYKCDRELVKVRLANLDNDRECVFVADKDNKVIGFIHVEKYDILYAASMVNVLGLAVSDEFRKQGIGTKHSNASYRSDYKLRGYVILHRTLVGIDKVKMNIFRAV